MSYRRGIQSLAATCALVLASVGAIAAAPEAVAQTSSPSPACTLVNSGALNGTYNNHGISGQWAQGEKLTVTASPPYSSTPTSIHLASQDGTTVPNVTANVANSSSSATLTTPPLPDTSFQINYGLDGVLLSATAVWTATCTPVPVCVPPPTGMTAWYPFDETSGTTTANHIPPPLNATLANGPSHVLGQRVSNSLSFDGVDDYVQAPPSAPNVGTGDFSIDFWLNTTANPSNQTIIDKRTVSSAGMPFVTGYSVATLNNRILLQLANGAGYTNYFSNTTVNNLGWVMVAITVNRTSSTGIRFYINGALDATANPTGRQGSLTNSAPLTMGRNLFNSVSMYKGMLDEVEIFSRVLLPGEVASIYNAGSAGKCK